MTDDKPRIAPGTFRDIGLVNTVITRIIGLATGGTPPNIFATLARHRGLFRRWLFFAGGLMPFGKLKRSESELVILYVAHLMRCEYEWLHHQSLGRKAGVSDEAMERIRREEIDSDQFTARERAFLRACRDIHTDGVIADGTYGELASLANDKEIIELCFLIGHYRMLAVTLNTLRVPLDEHPA
ncbi:MAG: carboxymuconolactone decarboxylase family protein [Deltaproteobacteria bacterium]|nr:carboxymuconolactone decarboxylase family protein [Deltaproteobacteria bacterium]